MSTQDLQRALTSQTTDTFVVAADDKAQRLQIRTSIEDLESTMMREFESAEETMQEINNDGLQEYIVGGSYTRQLLIPEDMIIVTKLWSKERLWIIASGEVTIYTELGMQHIKAPYVGKAPFGTKVVLYTHADTLWFAVTGTDAEELEQVESDVITDDYKSIKYAWDRLEHNKENK